MWCDVAKDVIQAINILWVITGGLLQYKLHGIHVLRRGHVDVLLLCDDGWLLRWDLIASWWVHYSLSDKSKITRQRCHGNV